MFWFFIENYLGEDVNYYLEWSESQQPLVRGKKLTIINDDDDDDECLNKCLN